MFLLRTFVCPIVAVLLALPRLVVAKRFKLSSTLLMLIVLLHGSQSQGGLVGVGVSGTVTFASELPSATNTPRLGLPKGAIPVGALYSGQFVFDTNTAPTELSFAGPNGTEFISGYHQQRLNGFTGNVGGYPITANDYWVLVYDSSSADAEDFVTVRFSTTTNFPPTSPSTQFFFNNQNKANAIYQLEFNGPYDLFTGRSLPSIATILGMTPGFLSFVGSSGGSGMGYRFGITSVFETAAPEPATATLLLCGVVAAVRIRRRRG